MAIDRSTLLLSTRGQRTKAHLGGFEHGGRTSVVRHLHSKRHTTLSDSFVLFAAIAVLAIIVPAALITGYSVTVTLTNALQMLVVTYAALKLSALIWRGVPDWFDTLFWTFTYVFIGLAGLVQRLAGHNPYRVTFSDSSLQDASLLALLGMVTFDIAKVVTRGHYLEHRRVHRQRVLSVHRTGVLMVIALVTTPILVILLGGLDTLLLTRTERSAALTEAGLFTDVSKVRGGVLLTMSYALPLVASVAAIIAMQQDAKLRRRLAWVTGTGILVLMTLFIGNPVSASRFWTGTIALSLIFALRGANTARGYRVVACATVTALLFLFPYADYFRYRDSVATRGLTLGSLMANKGDYDGAAQMVSAIDYVAYYGTTHGQQTLGFLGFFIPRELWSGKPGATGALLSAFIGYPQANVSSPLWTEGYVDGGLIGVVLAFTILAVTSNWIQSERRSYKGFTPLPTLLLPLVAGYITIVLRGSLLSSAAGLFAIVALSLLVTRCPKQQAPSRRSI